MPTWTKEVVDLSVAGTALTIDSVKIDGDTIGHTDDTDLLTLASGALTIAGDTTITGDLTISGNDLTFGNLSMVLNSVTGNVTILVVGASESELELMGTNNDTYFKVSNLGSDKWCFGLDYNNSNFVICDGATLGSSGQEFVLTTAGHLTLEGGLTSGGDAAFTGNITVGGNIIKASDGGSTITLDTSDNVIIAGDLQVSGGDITGPTDNHFSMRSDGDMSFYIDSDNDDTNYFYWSNSITTVARLTEGGDLQLDGTLTVDDTTDTSNAYTGSVIIKGGVAITKKLWVETDLHVNGMANLDAVTVGVDGTGYDVKFFGCTAGSYMLWDESEDELEVYNADILCTSTNESNTTDPRVELYNNESSPSVDDSLGSVRWHGNNDADEKTLFGKIACLSETLTNGEENGEMRATIMNHGEQNVIWLKAEALTTADTVKCTFPQNGGLVIGANSSKQGTLTLWDGGGGNTHGYLVLYSPNGTANYIFCEDDGTLKRHTSAPTAISDGTVIGSQS